jgi:hypothetical protein
MFAPAAAGLANQKLLLSGSLGYSRHSNLGTIVSGCNIKGNISRNTGDHIITSQVKNIILSRSSRRQKESAGFAPK